MSNECNAEFSEYMQLGDVMQGGITKHLLKNSQVRSPIVTVSKVNVRS